MRQKLAECNAELAEAARLGGQARPGDRVQAFNRALACAQEAVRAAAGSAAAQWGWPPPESAALLVGALPQPGWHSVDYQNRLLQALQAARLPDFPASADDPGAILLLEEGAVFLLLITYFPVPLSIAEPCLRHALHVRSSAGDCFAVLRITLFCCKQLLVCRASSGEVHHQQLKIKVRCCQQLGCSAL